MKWAIGQTVVVARPSNRGVDIVERTVSKVGRKWITVRGQWTEERFDHEGRAENQTGWGSQLWPDRAAYDAHVEKRRAWDEFHSLVRQRNHPPAHLTTEEIRALTATVSPPAPHHI